MSATASTVGVGTLAGSTGLWSLVAVARFHGIDLSEDHLTHTYALGAGEVTARQIVRCAHDAKLQARSLRESWEGLLRLGEAFPAILRLRDGSYVILSGIRDDRGQPEVVIRNPLVPMGGFEFWSRAILEKVWGGELILVRRRYRLGDADRPFGLSWFIPEILRQGRAFSDVALAAIVLQLLGLALPMFFQLIIDKVVLHQTYSTLTTLSVGVLIAITFDALLNCLRTYLLLQATAKIDIRMATRVFAHLLALPLPYFERISSGMLLNHVQQARTIREFLTGRVFFAVLDAAALFVFVPVLVLYSPTLSLVVLGFASAVTLVIAIAARSFRRRLNLLYKAEAECQAHLVETIHGISTIKALSLEPMQRQQWDDRSADVVERHISVGTLSAGARAVSSFLEKAMTVAIVWVGVELVFSGTLSIGELVAFQMLAGRVTAPLMQLVTLINDYQQAAVSVKMLGEVMNTEPEQGMNRGLQPRLAGQLSFENVSFRYPSGTASALERISFAVPVGGVLGIVGRSGSGKSTLVRMLQGLYTARDGIIRIDGHDLRDIDRVHLRRHIGVVLQESFLFRGTVRDNIGVSRPDARFEDIVEAARLAGAEEFIQKLPQGYDTRIEEGGSNLSGGQKQRLAIARALLRQPSILILDEATSALDPESEAVLQRHMPLITRGRTTLIVSHRLPSIRKADAILVLHEGRMVGFGPHEHLLQTCEMYRHLWNVQTEALR